ncbi:MAG: hypothetical protein IPN34_11630 [Planctomycetes bacterium]|nr:hypothetical protein [Planctomycetota bacterium]
MRPHRTSGRVLAAGWRCVVGLAALHSMLLSPLAAQEAPAEGVLEDELRKIREEMERMRAGYEARISELERQMKERSPAGAAGDAKGEQDAASELDDALAELDQALLQSDDPARTRLSQTTRFDDFFNPSISAVLDFSASASTLDDSWEDYDQLRFRVGEIGMAAELDPYARAYAVFEFEEEEAHVAEFAGIFDLARIAEYSNGRFKAGRYFLDLDPLNRQHEHEYAFVQQPAVKIEMFGGNSLGNGIEYHDWFPVGDSPLRFSLGVASSVEGHNHTEAGGEHHDDDEAEPFGSRGFEDLAYTARVAWNTDLSQDDRLTIGGSVFYAPRLREFELDPGPPEETVAHDTRKLIEELDLSLQRNTPQGTGFTFTTAVFALQGRFVDEATDTRFDESSFGGYSWYENRFHLQWGAGVAFDWSQSSTDNDQKLYQYSAFLNWYPSETHRLRLQYQYSDTDPFDGARYQQDFHAVFLQWTVVLGSHNHGLSW